jgi:2-(1,2-epoxy-1,2-dihydrophenyl)acetyl-CoA isomerase
MSATTSNYLQLTQQHGVATLTFSRPEALNAINVPMALALRDAARQLTQDANVRCIVLRGEGRAFMAGGDLPTLQANPVQGAKDLIGPLHEAVELFAAGNAPVIAQVHGAAAGAGLSVMLQADFVLAAEGTQFNMAYIKLGASCDVGASWALPRIVGLRQALEIALLSEPLNTEQALRLGLINRVLPAGDLDAAVQQLAEQLAHGPTQAYGQMRRLMRSSWERTLPQQLDAEAQAFVHCAKTEDFSHGLSAFFAKQSASFIGQ